MKKSFLFLIILSIIPYSLPLISYTEGNIQEENYEESTSEESTRESQFNQYYKQYEVYDSMVSQTGNIITYDYLRSLARSRDIDSCTWKTNYRGSDFVILICQNIFPELKFAPNGADKAACQYQPRTNQWKCLPSGNRWFYNFSHPGYELPVLPTSTEKDKKSNTTSDTEQVHMETILNNKEITDNQWFNIIEWLWMKIFKTDQYLIKQIPPFIKVSYNNGFTYVTEYYFTIYNSLAICLGIIIILNLIYWIWQSIHHLWMNSGRVYKSMWMTYSKIIIVIISYAISAYILNETGGGLDLVVAFFFIGMISIFWVPFIFFILFYKWYSSIETTKNRPFIYFFLSIFLYIISSTWIILSIIQIGEISWRYREYARTVINTYDYGNFQIFTESIYLEIWNIIIVFFVFYSIRWCTRFLYESKSISNSHNSNIIT